MVEYANRLPPFRATAGALLCRLEAVGIHCRQQMDIRCLQQLINSAVVIRIPQNIIGKMYQQCSAYGLKKL